MKSTKDIFYNLSKLSKKWENYFEIYDRTLPRFIGKNPTMLIIGIANGGCIEMFNKYFDNEVTIYGVDINKEFLDHKYDNPNVFLSCVDQSNPEHWEAFLKNKPKFDIIIDDGGHEMQQQIVTLNCTYPHLNNDGLYIVEDTHTSYWSPWGGGLKKEDSFIEYTKNLIDLLHKDPIGFKTGQTPPEATKIFNNLKCVTYYNSITIIEKGITEPWIEAVSNSKQNPDFVWG